MTLPALSGDQDNYLFVTSSMTSLGTFRQFATSNSLFTVDYSGYLASGETLTSVAYSVSPTTSPVVAASSSTLVAINGLAAKGVSFLLGGGVEGNAYTVTVTATTSLAQTKVDTFKLVVTSQSKGACWPVYSSPVPATPPPTSEGTTRWAAVRVNVGTSVIVIAPQRNGRHAVTVVNAGASLIEIKESGSFVIGEGTPLAPNASFTLETQGAVYGLSDDPAGQVSVQETF